MLSLVISKIDEPHIHQHQHPPSLLQTQTLTEIWDSSGYIVTLSQLQLRDCCVLALVGGVCILVIENNIFVPSTSRASPPQINKVDCFPTICDTFVGWCIFLDPNFPPQPLLPTINNRSLSQRKSPYLFPVLCRRFFTFSQTDSILFVRSRYRYNIIYYRVVDYSMIIVMQ